MKTPRVLVVFNTLTPFPADKDYTAELKQPDWQTEADVARALTALEFPFEFAGLCDDLSVLQQKAAAFKPDIIFNLVERFNNNSVYETDFASHLNLLGVPFTGCDPAAMTLCKNKGLAKQLLAYHRVRVPQFVILPVKKPIHRPKRLDFPVFIKPLREEASLGISQASFVENDAQFRERVSFLHETLGQDVIAEEYIPGREIYVGILGNRRLEVFPPREMVFARVDDEDPKIATYKAKWDEAYRKKWGIKNKFADDLPEGLEEKIRTIAKRIYRKLLIRGYARLDMRLTPEGELVFIEANPNPMLAKDEDFALSAQKAGLDYPELIRRILQLAPAKED